MKRYLSAVAFGGAAVLAVAAYFLSGDFWQPLFLNLAGSLFAIGVAIIAVNIYLERARRREAISAILLLCHDAIADFHNTFLDIVWTKFGKDEFGDIVASYMEAAGDPMVIKPADRDKLYALAQESSDDVRRLADRLDEALSETTTLVGWELDPQLLAVTLKARHALRQYKAIDMDGSHQTKLAIAEHLIDIDIYTHIARSKLFELGGLKTEE